MQLSAFILLADSIAERGHLQRVASAWLEMSAWRSCGTDSGSGVKQT